MIATKEAQPAFVPQTLAPTLGAPGYVSSKLGRHEG